MFAKAPLVALSLLSVLAAATPTPGGGGESQCNTGNTFCCNTTQQSSSISLLSPLGALLNLVVGPLTGLVGLGCTPITIVGGGQGANCAQQPVCCSNNVSSGLLGLGMIGANCNSISL